MVFSYVTGYRTTSKLMRSPPSSKKAAKINKENVVPPMMKAPENMNKVPENMNKTPLFRKLRRPLYSKSPGLELLSVVEEDGEASPHIMAKPLPTPKIMAKFSPKKVSKSSRVAGRKHVCILIFMQNICFY